MEKKPSKLGCILSLIAIIISLVGIIDCRINDLPLDRNVALFLCMIAVFFGNLVIYQSIKKK